MQRINLYQSRFRPIAVRLNLLQAELLVGGLLLLVITATVWLERFSTQQNQEEQRLTLAVNSLEQQVKLRKKELDDLRNDQSLDAEIVSLNREISARKSIIEYVDTRVIGSSQGYTRYLDDLANLEFNQVWLNDIAITPTQMRVKGSAMDAAEIPRFLQKIQQLPVFQGKDFDLFTIKRQSDEDWKVDFELATQDPELKP